MAEILTLDAAPVVRNAGELRRALLDAFQKSDEVVVGIPDVCSVDLCGLQLLEAARRHSAATGKIFALERPATGFRDILDAAGFLTDAAPETLQFWLHEGPAQ